jgi:hypothetical protein
VARDFNGKVKLMLGTESINKNKGLEVISFKPFTGLVELIGIEPTTS